MGEREIARGKLGAKDAPLQTLPDGEDAQPKP
jgi:hypothetical protein